MRKFLLVLLSFVILSVGGCQKSSDSFISFNTFKHPIGSDSAIHMTETDFFADDLIIIFDEKEEDKNFINSDAGILFNITDKEAVFSKNVYKKAYPASLTKLLTALVAIQHGDLDELTTISYEASHILESGAKLCGFEEGDVISLDELLYCLLIYSGNDAAIAIAEHIGGSVEGFNTMMNQEAQRIGAVHSNFTNAHGLHDDQHYTTLYDMYLVFNEFLKYDYLTEIIGISSYTSEYHDKEGNAKQITMDSTNQFFNGEVEEAEGFTIIGGKTGNTYSAGNCLILLCRGSDGDDYITAIMKAPDRDTLYSEINKLLSISSN